MVRKMLACVVSVRDRAARLGMAAAVCVAAMLVAGQALAQAPPVTLPDIGVDVEGTATAIGVALGAIVAGLITLFGAFFIVRLGVKWIRGMVK